MSLRLAPLTTRTLPATILVGALAMSNILAASAAGSPPEPSSRVNLGGHVPGWAQAGADLGAVAPDLELRQLTLVLKRPPTRQQAFDALLEELHDPASPNYQRWLTPSEIGRRFGTRAGDVCCYFPGYTPRPEDLADLVTALHGLP